MTAFLSLLSPTSIMAGIIVALTLSNAFFINRWSAARDDYIEYKAQVSQAQAQIENDMQRRLRLSDQVTADIKSDLSVALDTLRSRPSVRVRQTGCNTRGLSPLSTSASGITQAPVTDPVDPPVITAEQCQTYLEDGIEDAVKFAFLQSWVVQQHEESK